MSIGSDPMDGFTYFCCSSQIPSASGFICRVLYHFQAATISRLNFHITSMGFQWGQTLSRLKFQRHFRHFPSLIASARCQHTRNAPFCQSSRRHVHSPNNLHHAFSAYYAIFPQRQTPSASSAHKTAQSRAHTNSARMWQCCSGIFDGWGMKKKLEL